MHKYSPKKPNGVSQSQDFSKLKINDSPQKTPGKTNNIN